MTAQTELILKIVAGVALTLAACAAKVWGV
jgi:hypothetical protein